MKFFLSLMTPFILSCCYLVAKAHFPHDVVEALAVNDNDKSEVCIGMRKVLLCSNDAGMHWQFLRQFVDLRNYIAISPYDESLYVVDGEKLLYSPDRITWEVPEIAHCTVEYYTKLLGRTTFVKSGALIAGRGKLFKEDKTLQRGFRAIHNEDFNNCPALAAVSNSETVYAGGTAGLMRSLDGGDTWDLVHPMDSILKIVINDDVVVVMTNKGICYMGVLTKTRVTCRTLFLNDTAPEEKVRDGPSPPIDISYSEGMLYVTRANSYAVYRTADFGDKWNTSNQMEGDFETFGHKGLGAWAFNGREEYSHAAGNFIGTWKGVFNTQDGGNTWQYRDTVRKAITAFSLSKGSDGEFTVSICTYAGGCYIGVPPNLVAISITNGFYEAIHLAPTYDSDEGIFGFENGRDALFYLQSEKKEVNLRRGIDETLRVTVKGVTFSPSFNTNKTLFAYGYNLGVQVSIDGGDTFVRIFNGRGGDVQRLCLSPNFEQDGTIVLLVDENSNGLSRTIEGAFIYVSNDRGENWRKVIDEKQPWRDIVLVAGTPDPIIVALDEVGMLFSHLATPSKDPFQKVANTVFREVRPAGFGFDGLAVSPDGATLAAGWAEGGIMFGTVTPSSRLVDRRSNKPSPWNTTSLTVESPFVVTRNPPVDDSENRILSSHIMFSPEYEKDDTIFACDMYSVYKSTDRGRHWEEVFQF